MLYFYSIFSKFFVCSLRTITYISFYIIQFDSKVNRRKYVFENLCVANTIFFYVFSYFIHFSLSHSFVCCFSSFYSSIEFQLFVFFRWNIVSWNRFEIKTFIVFSYSLLGYNAFSQRFHRSQKCKTKKCVSKHEKKKAKERNATNMFKTSIQRNE